MADISPQQSGLERVFSDIVLFLAVPGTTQANRIDFQDKLIGRINSFGRRSCGYASAGSTAGMSPGMASGLKCRCKAYRRGYSAGPDIRKTMKKLER